MEVAVAMWISDMLSIVVVGKAQNGRSSTANIPIQRCLKRC